MPKGGTASLVELRVLDGPNLYFTRPAVKLTVAVPGWIGAPEARVERAAARFDPAGSAGHAGRPGSESRRRFVVRLAARMTRGLAGATGTRLAVRARPGPEPDEVVLAYPWPRRTAAEAFGREVAELLDAMLSSRKAPARLVREAARRGRAAE